MIGILPLNVMDNITVLHPECGGCNPLMHNVPKGSGKLKNLAAYFQQDIYVYICTSFKVLILKILKYFLQNFVYLHFTSHQKYLKTFLNNHKLKVLRKHS